MCGIVGMSFRKNVSFRQSEMRGLRNMFTEMLIQAQARGSAATGVTLVGHDPDTKRPKIYVARSPLPAKDFVKTKEYEELLQRLDNQSFSIIGHTRAPSGNAASAADNKNNHPFVCGPIVGVHNGRIVNTDEIWKALNPIRTPKSSCDSESLFGLIEYYVSENGLDTESAIEEAIKMSLGWMAIALVNAKEPEKVYLFHDDMSPMEVGFWSYIETALFASDYKYIEEGLKKSSSPNSTSIKRYTLDPEQLVVLDSTVKGSTFSSLFASSRRIQEDGEAKAKVVAEHKSSYEATQGK